LILSHKTEGLIGTISQRSVSEPLKFKDVSEEENLLEGGKVSSRISNFRETSRWKENARKEMPLIHREVG
jgi:hypothetical protein